MSGLFYRVIESRDLSKEISSAPEFLSCHNDQSLVEIIVTRIISAVRETNSIQQHARCLVQLLQSCLAHSLRPGSKGDPPHAKMASDIMSCLFLNYNKKPVMLLAIPVAVKFLHKGNKDLSRNMSSYLSLAAIENADTLAVHVQPILDSVISGNYSLSRVLPAIFSVDRQLINNHVMTLVSILPNCTDSDSLALLNLFELVAKESPALLEPSIPQLCECLLQQTLAASTLQVLQGIAQVLPQSLVDHLAAFKSTADNFPKTTISVVHLLTVVCLPSIDKSREVLKYLLEIICKVEVEKHSLVLK
ncbi:ventricular zone-expressed PH domain-containing protein homolog 1, partial [Eurytemora carolleeae]|uniref:ventricular zone-expressed PH domain-containing protein homolog 1 n=1 Tax=Eurytemora carolleeae TaxID=1294199 RepID=UPI000C77A6EC